MALKPRSREQGKKSRSGSTLSMPRAGTRGSRRVDYYRKRVYYVKVSLMGAKRVRRG